MSEEYKSPDELFEEMEEELEQSKTTEQQLVEQGMAILERTVIDAKQSAFTVYLYTIEDREPFIAAKKLEGVDKILEYLQQWLPARVKFAVRKRVIGVDGTREEIIETRIRQILGVQPIDDFRLPWQRVTVRRRHRIYIRTMDGIIFFDETENAAALEDYMKAKGEIELDVIMVTAGNVKIEEADRIQGIYWLTREMWRSLKQRMEEGKEEVAAEEAESDAGNEGAELPEEVTV